MLADVPPEKLEAFLESVKLGTPRRMAARMLEIAPAVINRTFADGRKNSEAHESDGTPLTPNGRLWRLTEAAEAYAEHMYLEVIREVARNGKHDGDRIKAAQWVLQTLWPETYVQAPKTEITINQGAASDAKRLLKERFERMRKAPLEPVKPDAVKPVRSH